jgi:hypothetical protein
MVLSGETVRRDRRLQSACQKLIFLAMAIVGMVLIAQMSIWFVLPGVVLSYGALIGLSVSGRTDGR